MSKDSTHIKREIHSLASDLDMLTGAIQAGQHDTAVRIAEGLEDLLPDHHRQARKEPRHETQA